MNNEARFTGKTIIVTGAASGIGLSTAKRLAQEGARVIAVDISEDRLNDLTASGPLLDIVTVSGDLVQSDTITAVIEKAGNTIDGLANVAGIMDGFLPPSEIDDDTWNRVMAVNLTGPMRLTRAVLPAMIRAGVGSIVNVASEAALRGSAAGAAYTASKHAIVGYTKSVAFMHGPQGIRANAVAPGPVATNIEAMPKSEYGGARSYPLIRAIGLVPAEADRLAAAITWLLSDDSLNVNGATLPSDGGWSVA